MVKMVKGKALVPSRSGSTQNMAANITVVVRVRPLNERELGSNSRIVVQVIDENHLVFDPKEDLPPFYYQGVQQPSKNYLKRANKELKYAFDCVCGPQDTNENVFEKATKDMLACLMEGYNCSVFVYGATGAGKTFTMIGSKEYPGITYLTMDHLFRTIGGLQIDREFDIGVSYIEVYNENVFDLLKPSHTPLQLRDFPQYGVTVAGLSIHKIKTARELLDMLESGNQNRTQHPTDANAESSRSHAVFQVYVTMRCKTSNQCRMVKLSMIDLAGSERASATGCVGERFKEGANINRSLLALGNCINKLADGSSYIPYRDSKLTRLLKDSLGGNCKTVMIANVSPSSLSYEDTYNTLKYAARANKIQLSIKKNIIDRDMDTAHCMKTIKELQKRNDDLAKELKEAKEEETKWEKKAKELQAKLSLSTYAAPVIGNKLSRAKHDLWKERIEEMVQAHVAVEGRLVKMMSQQRVLSLRQLLRSRAFEQVADLVLRSSCDALEQIRTEELPRQERASENHIQQKINRNVKIMDTWKKWAESKAQLQKLLDDCLAECPYMEDAVNLVRRESELRLYKASNDLKDKLIDILKEEIRVSTDCMSDAHKLLRNCYLVLKGSSQATPALTAEYTAVINKLKSAKNITWSDKHVKNDPHFKFILDLDLENPTEPLEFNDERKPQENNTTLDVITDSEDLTDVEMSKPTAKKRKGTPMKGTPIKLKNNETILIDDSLELMDMENLNSAKKMKTESDVEKAENFPAIDPKDLNSTFVLAGNMDLKKCPDKVEPKQVPVKRPLGDHNIPRPINFNGDNKGSRPVPVKPVPPMRRVGAVAPPPRGAAFGSSVPRETALYKRVQAGTRKTPVTQNSVGYKAARERARAQFTPYMRLEVKPRQ